jgi:hypothetical protein
MNIAAVEFHWACRAAPSVDPHGLRMWDNHEIEIIWDGSGLWSLR